MTEVPLHPFLVHFPIGGWIIGTIMLWLGISRKSKDWDVASWFCLGLAAVVSIPAALVGQADYAQLSDPILNEAQLHRQLGNILPWLMGGLVVYRAHSWFKKDAYRPPRLIFALIATLIAILTIFTGLLGGKLVYLLGASSGGFSS